MNARETLIDATGVSKKYCRNFQRSLRHALDDMFLGMFTRRDQSRLRTDEFWAVKDVSFTLQRGESLGVIGHNGAGKSTLLKLMTGQRQLTEGSITTRGRVLALAELAIGFDPVLTGRENAFINAAVLGMSRRELAPVIDEIIEFSGLHEFIDSAVQTYSAGMKARLGFSVAAHLNPDILVVDEVLAVGDLNFRRKCVRHIQNYLRSGGSMVLVAHDPHLVQSVCNRCLVLDHGHVIFDGSAVEGVDVHFRIGVASAASTRAIPVSAPRGDAPGVLDDATDDAAVTGADALHDGRDGTAFTGTDVSDEPSDEHPIVLDRFEVHGEAEAALRTDGAAVVTLACRSRIEATIGWGFTICTSDLQTSIATCVVGLDGKGVPIQRGENILRCRIPRLPLRPEVYAIRGAVIDPTTKSPIGLLGFENLPNYFVVASDRVEPLANVQSAVGDLISLQVEWLD